MGTTPAVPRSLTQMLRERDDSVLVHLLLDRPDLAFPAPSDLSEVASRATTRQSVTEALSLLNAFELWVTTRAVAMSASFTFDDLLRDDDAAAGDPEAVRTAVVRLVDLGLLWGEPSELTALRPVRAMAALLEGTVAGPAPSSSPPTPAGETRTPALVDKLAAGSAFELVRRMDVLLEHCGHQPPALRRDGKMSTRELRSFATLLDISSATTTTLFELAMLSGLLGAGSDTMHEVLLPTRAFDEWQTLPLADQWCAIAETWFTGHLDSGPQWLKQLVLAAFGDPAHGKAVAADEVLRWVDWHRPRRPVRSDKIVTTMLDQAAWLGITGMGALASFAPTVDADALDALLPTRVDHVLIQADLTAVAPGPLTADAAHDLGTLADVESRGGATVYRLSPGSLTRAHRLGWSATEILTTLQQRSRTAVPQALEYLVHDLDRHRAATGDEPRTSPHLDPARGTAVLPDEQTVHDRLDPDLAVDLVAGLRAGGEPDARTAGSGHGAGEPLYDSPLATLREAVETGEVVWVGYVDPLGSTGERLVRARLLDDGLLQAQDASSEEEFSLAVHRITAAHIIRAAT